MANTNGGTAEIQRFKQLFNQGREPSKRVLVEFYEADWETISKWREDLDMSWKEFFRAITLWMTAFEKNEALQEQVARFVRKPEDKP